MLYTLLVFLHVMGAAGLFAVWGIEALAVAQLARTRAADRAQEWLALRRKSAPVGAVSMITLLVTGLALMSLRGGPEPWTAAAIAEVILMMATAIVARRRIAPRLAAGLAGAAGDLPTELPAAVRALYAGLRFRLAGGVAILALMTLKPGLAGSVAIVGAGIAAGLAASVRAGGAVQADAVKAGAR